MITAIAITVLVVLLLALLLRVKELTNEKENKLETQVINTNLSEELKSTQLILIELQNELGEEREKNRKILSQKKSSETRLGQISEHVLPFLDSCTHDPKSLRFLGSPVDLIAFDFDAGAITFIEVKSGNSKASKRQKIIKNIIKTGRVYYEEIRINEKGIATKKAINEDN